MGPGSDHCGGEAPCVQLAQFLCITRWSTVHGEAERLEISACTTHTRVGISKMSRTGTLKTAIFGIARLFRGE